MADRIGIIMPQSRRVSFGGGSVSLTVSSNLSKRMNQRLKAAQSHLDREVLSRCAPYVPYLTGALLSSGYRSTVIGSGLVTYTVGYASRQYYKGRREGTSKYGPLRGRFWFERMKAANLNSLKSGVAAIIGGEIR